MNNRLLRDEKYACRVFFSVIILIALSIDVTRAQECPLLVWADEFEGSSLDLSKWEPQIGDGCDINLCGWGNNEKQFYKAENATVDNGTLKITAKIERNRGSQYTSARLRTINLGDWTYGRFEASIRLPVGDGLWPAFWMLPTDEVYGGWPHSGEIDIMESRGTSSEVSTGTIHFGEAWPDNRMTGEPYLNRVSPWSDGFHRYAIEWEPGVLRWYIDDVLFSTKTTADLRGRNWPFDQRFHFIFNMAVGGTLGGTIDDSIFPVDIEADWVRVWDKGRAAVSGPTMVHPNASGAAYSVVGEVGTGGNYSWTVPAGATLVSGQGTSSIVVDWGTTGGTISVAVSNSCLSQTLNVPVHVQPARALDFVFEDFESNRNVTLTSTSGTLNGAVSNPDPSGVNTSSHVAQYTRSSADKYDTIIYGSADIGDADLFTSGSKKLFFDVYTNAPVGTQVSIGLENSSAATASNYPTGRHSSYTTRTSVQNAWERLEFDFEGTPDGATAGTSVNQIVIQFDPAWNSGDTYYFDNFVSHAVDGSGGGGGGGEATSVHVASVVTGTQSAGGGNKHGTATVTIQDDLGQPVADATVTGTFSGTFNETKSGVTGANGSVTLTTTATAKGSVTVNFCVDDVTHASLAYDAASNVQTCNSPGKRGTVDDVLPAEYELLANYPNPFNPTTQIAYALPEASNVRLAVYDVLGKVVAVLVDRRQDAGLHTAAFDATDLPSGVYAYTLSADGFTDTKIMTLLR